MAANKGAVAGLAAILVVAMVVAVAVGVTRKNGEVIQGLSHANTTNPKELIKAAFDFTLKNIGDVVKNSPLFKEASHDKSTKEALEICQQVLDIAIDDLKMSFDSVEEFDVVNASEYVEDLKTWLSAVITNQETCIDAFDNTTGDTGEKMKNLLKTAREMSSNGLAMVTDMSSFLTSLQLGNVAARKLLSKEGRFLYGGDPTDYAPGEEPTSFVSNIKRSLIALKHNAVSEKIGYGGDPTDYAPGEEPPFHLDSIEEIFFQQHP
ncbi:UNVERIFIED_CONTAM: putative pectinesterase/pectinesterase inhibitor 21 [Sesamum angustifolium]|uniref:Pectinesterase/pectinesterase inhibitor 21 n=1 Tax=Sesamum angustifolium TaxID=2727405 RepID=A0AAW2LW88_9LAMI